MTTFISKWKEKVLLYEYTLNKTKATSQYLALMPPPKAVCKKDNNNNKKKKKKNTCVVINYRVTGHTCYIAAIH